MTQRKGFTLVEIMIVVAIIALLAAIAIPSFLKSRQSACINNLRLIDHAKQQLATASQTLLDSNVPVWTDIQPYFKGGGTPFCRQGGTYAINAITSNPTCTYAGHVLINDIK